MERMTIRRANLAPPWLSVPPQIFVDVLMVCAAIAQAPTFSSLHLVGAFASRRGEDGGDNS